MWVNRHHHSYFWNTQTVGLVFWFQCQKQVNMGNRWKQVCPISVPSHHLESKAVLHKTFTRTQGFVHGKMVKHDKHMYFWNVTQLPTFVSQSLLFSAEFLTPSSRSRLSRTPLPGSNHIPPTTMTSRWTMESFLLQTGVKFRINHAYGRLLGKVICGQVDKNMAI